MTRDGMCGVFIPDRVLAGWWRNQWKASDRKWASRCITVSVVVHGCETWSLILREVHRLRVFENRMLRKIPMPKGYEVQ